MCSSSTTFGHLGYWPGESRTRYHSGFAESPRAFVLVRGPRFTSSVADGDTSRLDNESLGWPLSVYSEDIDVSGNNDLLRPSTAASSIEASSSRAGISTRLKTLLAGFTDMGGIDWRAYPPPFELFNIPSGTSSEIESIVKPSIERLQDFLAQEESLRQKETYHRCQEEGKGKKRMAMSDDHDQDQGQGSTQPQGVRITRLRLERVTCLTMIRHCVEQLSLSMSRIVMETSSETYLTLVKQATSRHLRGTLDTCQVQLIQVL